MSAIKFGVPLLPASIEFLEENYLKFDEFIKKINLTRPISLSIDPLRFEKLNKYIKIIIKK